jgi:hypothetical protein
MEVYNIISDIKFIKIKMFMKIACVARMNFRGETLDIGEARGG